MRTATGVLALVAMALLAGCLGGVSGTVTPTDTDSPRPTVSPLPEETVSLPDGPKTAPEPPAEMDAESVREYVRTYEYRYAYNSLWYSDNSNVNLDCEVDDVEEISAGWRAVVTCIGYSNTGGEAPGTATATELHADWGTQTFVYYVDEDSVIRERQDAGG
ncbi:MAG: hypothetical protein V5A23_00260 [Halobacteriales archaeon]